MDHLETQSEVPREAATGEAGEAARFALVSLDDPQVRFPLTPPGPVRAGRRSDNDLVLPDDGRVSREHCVLRAAIEGGEPVWHLVDLGSRHGTTLNGVRLTPDQRCPLHAKDRIRIGGHELEVVDEAEAADPQQVVQTLGDEEPSLQTSMVTSADPASLTHWPAARLALLLRFAQQMNDADTEDELAEAILDAAVEGSGFPNAALLRVLPAQDTLAVVAGRGEAVGDEASSLRISRTLVEKARSGDPAKVIDTRTGVSSHSIVEFGIDAAVCVPITANDSVVGMLYVDRRSETAEASSEHALLVDFVVSLGHLASMAMANLLRRQLESRLVRFERDLNAAAEVQRLILPPREGRFGRHAYRAVNQPGQLLSGDFYDVIPIDEHRLVATLGDAVGKGAQASVLMTTVQGFLQGAVARGQELVEAIGALNRYIAPRCQHTRFITLWAGLFDAEAGTLTYVDAGHGYAYRLGADGQVNELREGGGQPLGIDARNTYQATVIPWQPGDRVILISDGVAEQPTRASEGDRRSFGIQPILDLAWSDPPVDEVRHLLDGLADHAGGEVFDDDVTILCLRQTAS